MRKRIICIMSCLFILMNGCSTQKESILSIADLRNELSKLDYEETRNLAIEYYEELLARDDFTKEDYLALADLYQKENDNENQRRILRKLFKSDPTLENARLLSDVVFELDLQDQEVLEILNSALLKMSDRDASGLRELILSDEWKTCFQEEAGLIESHLFSKDEEKMIRIRTSSFETEITCEKRTGEFSYFRINEAGCVLMFSKVNENGYDGVSEIGYYDENLQLYKEIQCTLNQDHCIDMITIIYDGMIFSGALNDDGTTAVEQIDQEIRAKNVVYAMTSDGNSYLVQSNTEVSEFILDLEYLHLPMYEAWSED